MGAGRKREKEKWGECCVGGEKREEWGSEGAASRCMRAGNLLAARPVAYEGEPPEAAWCPSESDKMQVRSGANEG